MRDRVLAASYVKQIPRWLQRGATKDRDTSDALARISLVPRDLHANSDESHSQSPQASLASPMLMMMTTTISCNRKRDAVSVVLDISALRWITGFRFEYFLRASRRMTHNPTPESGPSSREGNRKRAREREREGRTK